MTAKAEHRDITPPAAEGLDVIGDIHGCAHTLERLLEQMGYQKVRGVYRHPRRQVVFLGDIIDRGPRVREALARVRDMVDAGSAYLILGNHEINALCYCTPHPAHKGNYLRPHTPRKTRIISETLEQFANYHHDWQDHLRWLRQRPLYIDFGCARVVHACWDHKIIANRPSAVLTQDELYALSDPQSTTSIAVKRLTTGLEFSLPKGVVMHSAEGFKRHTFRARFWGKPPQTLGDLQFQPDPLPADVAAMAVPDTLTEALVMYDESQPPLFVGHYWLTGRPAPVAVNIACLDYSAVKFGRLVAYRTSGEQRLHADNFEWVYVDP